MDCLIAGAVLGASLLHASWHALARLYREADLGQAYPLARGLTPVMAAVLAAIALGETPSAPAAAGIGLVCAGLLLLAFEQRGRGITTLTFTVSAGAGLAVAA
ncbi:MAG: hypothetical protein ACREUQ_06835 [Burkholderiales bacterium]